MVISVYVFLLFSIGYLVSASDQAGGPGSGNGASESEALSADDALLSALSESSANASGKTSNVVEVNTSRSSVIAIILPSDNDDITASPEASVAATNRTDSPFITPIATNTA